MSRPGTKFTIEYSPDATNALEIRNRLQITFATPGLKSHCVQCKWKQVVRTGSLQLVTARFVIVVLAGLQCESSFIRAKAPEISLLRTADGFS